MHTLPSQPFPGSQHALLYLTKVGNVGLHSPISHCEVHQHSFPVSMFLVTEHPLISAYGEEGQHLSGSHLQSTEFKQFSPIKLLQKLSPIHLEFGP